ncbi:TniQ family protein [Lichenicoccus roseus]|uniref:TniQ family protein n=1 Tax=Lichenicoccus roseus TaxID=2683649 RepID=A0A5R9J1M8_9PROT|nr:TniQ family protein [Lichenicoccus roseus]
MQYEESRPLRLPLRCAPETDESLTGYILRLALRNHQLKSASFAAAAGVRQLPILYPTAEQIDRLAVMADVPGDVLSSMGAERIRSSTRKKDARLRGFAIPRDWLSIQRRACPICLEESPYHRTVWDIAHVRVCARHSCKLIASCPDCGQRFGWGNSDLRRCSCGTDISRWKSPSGDPAAARWIGGAFFRNGSPPPKLLDGVQLVPAVTAVALLEAAFRSRLVRDLADPLGLQDDIGQAFAYRAFDSDTRRFHQALMHVEDKPSGKPFRIARNGLIRLSILCARTSGLEGVRSVVDAHLKIPVPGRGISE